MLRKIIASALMSFAFLLSQVSFANVQLENGKTYLFIQTSNKAEIKKTNTPGTYTIKLSDVSPYVAYFTDRPNRETGQMPITQFLAEWSKGNDSFAKDKPNAAIEGVQSLISKGNLVNYVVALSQPVYDEKHKTLTYTAQTLKGEKELANSTLFHSVIFIDGICYGCIG